MSRVSLVPTEETRHGMLASFGLFGYAPDVARGYEADYVLAIDGLDLETIDMLIKNESRKAYDDGQYPITDTGGGNG